MSQSVRSAAGKSGRAHRPNRAAAGQEPQMEKHSGIRFTSPALGRVCTYLSNTILKYISPQCPCGPFSWRIQIHKKKNISSPWDPRLFSHSVWEINFLIRGCSPDSSSSIEKDARSEWEHEVIRPSRKGGSLREIAAELGKLSAGSP